MKKRILSVVLMCSILCAVCSGIFSVQGTVESEVPLVVTEVGVPGETKKVGTAFFMDIPVAAFFQIFLSKPLDLATTNDVNNYIYDLFRFNGEGETGWLTAAEWRAKNSGSVRIEYNADLSILTVFLNYDAGIAKFTQPTDIIMYIDPGLVAADGSAMAEGQGFFYGKVHPNVGNWPCVPYIAPGADETNDSAPFVVTQMGFMNSNAKFLDEGMWGVITTRLYLSKPMNLPNGSVIEGEINNLVRINGKTVAQWRAQDEAIVNLKYYADEQLINVTFYYVGDLVTGNALNDIVVFIDPGLTAADGTEMTAGQGFQYVRVHQNIGAWPSVQYTAPENAGDPVPLQITEVGFTNTNQKRHNFMGQELIRLYLSKPLDYEHNAVLGAEVTDLIRLNDKTVTEWRGEDPNNIELRYYETEQLINISLPDSGSLSASIKTNDFVMYVDPGLVAADGTEMTEGKGYICKAKHENAGDWPSVPYQANTQVENGPIAVGAFPGGYGMAESGGTCTFQVKFGRNFRNPASIPENNVGAAIGNYIVINGKTVSEWNGITAGSVVINVKRDTSLGGQYLEIITNNLTEPVGSVYGSDIVFLPDFPIYAEGTLGEYRTFTYVALSDRPWVRRDDTYFNRAYMLPEIKSYLLKKTTALNVYTMCMLKEHFGIAAIGDVDIRALLMVLSAPNNWAEAAHTASLAEDDFVWNFKEDAEGFTSAAGNLSAAGEKLIWKNGTVPLYSGGSLAVNAKKYHTVEIRLANESASALNLSWKKSGEAFTSPVSIPIKNDGKYHDYQIELGQQSGWNGTIDQLSFTLDSGSPAGIEFIRISGLYLAPFPFLSGNFAQDKAKLLEMKTAFSAVNDSVTLGFSALTEYLSATTANGDYMHQNSGEDSGTFNPYYLLKLAKATEMPIMLWLRGDPWGYSENGAYNQLYSDNNNKMWLANNSAFTDTETGYAYLCLAQTDLNGQTTDYWQKTDKLLGQAAGQVGRMIEDNPAYFLGVTTTSEYQFTTKNDVGDLDYNPKTIKEFRDWCQWQYSTISALNSAMGTGFTSYDLKYTNYTGTTANAGGFDAPRTRNISNPFWQAWKMFRAEQIRAAVERQVEIVSRHIDTKYIYTHQIDCYDDSRVSPSTSGNIPGSNVGIDYETKGASPISVANIQKVAGFVKEDVSRSWGIPEWLVNSGNPSGAEVTNAIDIVLNHRIKYLSPFNWGSGDIFETKGKEGIIVNAINNH